MDEHPPLPSVSRGQTPLKAFVNARWGRRFYEFNLHSAGADMHSHTHTHSLTHSLWQDSLPGKRGSTLCGS